MKKKNILIVITHMGLGGAQKALVSVLNEVNFEKYNIEVQVITDGGFNIKYLPLQVKILPTLMSNVKYYGDTADTLKRALKKFDLITLIRRIYYTGLKKINREKNEAYTRYYEWQFIKRYIPSNSQKYDVAIGFLDSTPHYYVMDKVNARKKVCWIHNDYSNLPTCKKDIKYLEQADKVVTISPKCVNEIKKVFPKLKEVHLVYNLNSLEFIKKLSKEIIKDDIFFNETGMKILSIGRITEQKAYHLAVEAAEILKKKNIRFHWYILGDGHLRQDIQKLIDDANLNSQFTILGIRENPYPYILNADIIVQSSIYEGKSIALDEAKMLNKVIVCTDYNSARDQIIDKKTGIIVPISSSGIVEGIEQVCDNSKLKDNILNNLKEEEYDQNAYYLEYEKIFDM